MSENIIQLQIPSFPYYLDSGRSDFRKGDQHPNRRNLGIYDLLVMVKGELHIGENHKQWTLTTGDTLLLLPDGEHYAIKPCEMETVFYWVHFEHISSSNNTRESSASDSLEETLDVIPPFSNPYTLRIPKHTQLTDPQGAFVVIQTILDLPINNSFWQEQQLFAELLAMLEHNPSHGAGSAAFRLAERTATYIQEHYREKLTNKSIAASLHFHANYIVRCMKSRYEQTPMDYLHQFRLQQAKRLLLTTEWSIDRIAEEVGFRYAPYFSACFKQSLGVSPLRFRKQHLK